MKISDLIAAFIRTALQEEGGVLELQRQELAERFGCVPSQINYVIQTRFSPEHGFIVESQRGGGGYIRIRRVQVVEGSLIMHTVNTIGEQIDLGSLLQVLRNLYDAGALSKSEAALISAAASDRALADSPPTLRPTLRASIAKHALVAVLG